MFLDVMLILIIFWQTVGNSVKRWMQLVIRGTTHGQGKCAVMLAGKAMDHFTVTGPSLPHTASIILIGSGIIEFVLFPFISFKRKWNLNHFHIWWLLWVLLAFKKDEWLLIYYGICIKKIIFLVRHFSWFERKHYSGFN